MIVEYVILAVVCVDLVALLVVAGVGAGQRKLQRRQEWREIRQPPDKKGPPND